MSLHIHFSYTHVNVQIFSWFYISHTRVFIYLDVCPYHNASTYVYMYVWTNCMFIYIYIYVYVYTHVHICVRVCAVVCVYVCTRARTLIQSVCVWGFIIYLFMLMLYYSTPHVRVRYLPSKSSQCRYDAPERLVAHMGLRVNVYTYIHSYIRVYVYTITCVCVYAYTYVYQRKFSSSTRRWETHTNSLHSAHGFVYISVYIYTIPCACVRVYMCIPAQIRFIDS